MRRHASTGLTHGTVAAAALILLGSAAQAATVPYVETFDTAITGTTLPSDFVEGGSGGATDYTIESDPPVGNDLQAFITAASSSTTGVGSNRSAAVAFPDLTSSSFTVSTEFTVDSFTVGGAASTLNLGLAARGTDPNFSLGNNYRLLYTLSGSGNTGKLTLTENGTGAANLGGTLTSTGTLTPAAGLTGTLTLTGTQTAPGSITLTGTLVSGATTLTVTGTDTSPTIGQYFGYRTAVNAQLGASETGTFTTSENIDYDNFSVAVPEPASLGLLAIGGLALLGRRRRA